MPSTKIHGKLGKVSLGDSFPVRIMGAINLTTNSFYPGSVRRSPEEIVQTAVKMELDGADIIDLGARSTAPYRKSEISPEVETKLLKDAVRAIYSKVNVPISADTTRYEPAMSALSEGASILNDVYGFAQRDGPSLARLVSTKDCSLITTAHELRQGKVSMAPIERVSSCLSRSLNLAREHGVDMRKVAVDPGIGFFKDKELSNVEWNCTVLANLEELRALRQPICVGVSRKKFIGLLLGEIPVEDRLVGSLSAAAVCAYNGAHLIRTHDVKETFESMKIALAIREKRFNPRNELNRETTTSNAKKRTS